MLTTLFQPSFRPENDNALYDHPPPLASFPPCVAEVRAGQATLNVFAVPGLRGCKRPYTVNELLTQRASTGEARTIPPTVRTHGTASGFLPTEAVSFWVFNAASRRVQRSSERAAFLRQSRSQPLPSLRLVSTVSARHGESPSLAARGGCRRCNVHG